ncbi:MAG: hypothetical protein ACEQR8_09810 [Cypionkella sp.]
MLATGIARGNFGLALGAPGSVYIAEWEKRRVVLAHRGRLRTAARSAAGWAPSGVAWRAGVLYVLEATIHQPGKPDRLRVRRIGQGGDRVLATVAAGGG